MWAFRIIISAGVFYCSWCQTSIHFQNGGRDIIIYKYLWNCSSRDWNLKAKVHLPPLIDFLLLNLIDRWSHQTLHGKFCCAKLNASDCSLAELLLSISTLCALALICTSPIESPVLSWQVDPKTTSVTHWLLTIIETLITHTVQWTV